MIFEVFFHLQHHGLVPKTIAVHKIQPFIVCAEGLFDEIFPDCINGNVFAAGLDLSPVEKLAVIKRADDLVVAVEGHIGIRRTHVSEGQLNYLLPPPALAGKTGRINSGGSQHMLFADESQPARF